MDWEEYEHVDPREARRRPQPEGLEPERARRDRIRRTVLHDLYPHHAVAEQWFDEEDSVIPSYMASYLLLDVSDVRRALAELTSDGFLRGPHDLPRAYTDGNAIQYPLKSMTSMYHPSVNVEWDGRRWVKSLRPWGSWKTVRKPNGRVWLSPPRRLIERALRKARASRKPVDFDGRGFTTLRALDPFRRYGTENGLFRDRTEPEGRTKPEPEVCPRCGTEVRYRSLSGKRRRDHGVRKCDRAMVQKIMED